MPEEKTTEIVAEKTPAEGAEITPEGETPAEEIKDSATLKDDDSTEEPVRRDHRIDLFYKQGVKINRLEQKIKTLETGSAGDTQTQTEEVLTPPVPPKLNDFEYKEDYENARDQFSLDLTLFNQKVVAQKDTQKERRDIQLKQDTEQRDLYEEQNKGFDILRELHSDFDEVVNAEIYTDPIVKSAAEYDNHGEIIYELGTNIQELTRISRLSPNRQAYEVGILADKLSKIKPENKKITGASPPIETIGGDKTVIAKSPKDMSVKELSEYVKGEGRNIKANTF